MVADDGVPTRESLSPRAQEMLDRRMALADRVFDELTRAYVKHGADQWNRHEFYAILLEEVDELWDAIKRDEPQERVEAELVQVAAMCFRYFETGDRYRSPVLATGKET